MCTTVSSYVPCSDTWSRHMFLRWLELIKVQENKVNCWKQWDHNYNQSPSDQKYFAPVQVQCPAQSKINSTGKIYKIQHTCYTNSTEPQKPNIKWFPWDSKEKKYWKFCKTKWSAFLLFIRISLNCSPKFLDNCFTWKFFSNG